jgi:GTP cyclohydrolase II
MDSIRTTAGSDNGQPVITLSYAQSLDGSIAIRRGSTCTLSGSESQIITHKLRAAHDAILVGVNTVISDNPYLTVRLAEGRSPLPIVLDSHLRLPLNSNLLKNNLPPLIATTTLASQERQEKIEALGAKIIRVMPDERGWVDLKSLLGILTNRGISSIMVEGGARVITSFLAEHLVNWVVITIAPTFLGGLHAVENPLVTRSRKDSSSNGLPELNNCRYEQVGKDIVFSSELLWANR